MKGDEKGSSARAKDFRARAKAQTLRGLHSLLTAEALEAEDDAIEEAGGDKPLRDQDRKSNREVLETVDWAMTSSFGWGLAQFLPPRPVGRLPRGARRYFVSEPDATRPGERRRRACIQDGETRWKEVPQKLVGQMLVRPVLHVCQDMGKVSWHSSVYYVFALQARATVRWDRMHRHVCDRDDALSSCGLLVTKLEQMHVLGVRRKPWGKEGNHRLLLEATHQMFRECDEHSTLFQWFYADATDDVLPGTHGALG